MKLTNMNSRKSFSKIETKYEFDEMNNYYDKLQQLLNTYQKTGSNIEFVRAVELGDYDEPHLDESYELNEFQKLIEKFQGKMINNFQIRSYYNSNQIHTHIRPHSRSITIRYSPEIQDYINTVMNIYIDYYKKKGNETAELQNMFKEEKEDTKGHSFEPGNPLKK